MSAGQLVDTNFASGSTFGSQFRNEVPKLVVAPLASGLANNLQGPDGPGAMRAPVCGRAKAMRAARQAGKRSNSRRDRAARALRRELAGLRGERRAIPTAASFDASIFIISRTQSEASLESCAQNYHHDAIFILCRAHESICVHLCVCLQL